MMNPHREKELVNLIQRLIDLLGSDGVAINDRHTPKLYARFLDGLLKEYKEGKLGVKNAKSPTARVEAQPSPLPLQGNGMIHSSYQTLPLPSIGGNHTLPTMMPPSTSTWSPPDPPDPAIPLYFQVSQLYNPLQSQTLMDVDDPNSIYQWQAPLPPEFANSGYAYPHVVKGPQDTGPEHPSMQAFSDVFWSEYGAMPGYNSAVPYQPFQHGAEEAYSMPVEMHQMYGSQ